MQIPMSERKGRALLWGSTKSHPQGHPLQLQLCAAVPQLYTPPEKTRSRSTQILNIPEESVSFQESSAKTLMVCLQAEHREKGDALLGTGRAPAALREATKEKQITLAMRLGGRGEDRER